MADETNVPSQSFSRQVIAKLKDSRFWLIAGSTVLLDIPIIIFLDTRLAGLLTLGLGLAASYLIRQIDQFSKPQSSFVAATFYERTLIPALVGLVFIPGSDIFARIWVMPWHWFHSEGTIPSCSFVLSTAAVDWFGLVFSCVLVAVLMGRRADFAVMFGVALYIPLSLTDVFRGPFAEKSAGLVASSCKWLFDEPVGDDISAYRFGMALGVVAHVLVAIFVAKLIVSWRAARQDSSAEPTEVDTK
jgi:hypothetical protein